MNGKKEKWTGLSYQSYQANAILLLSMLFLCIYMYMGLRDLLVAWGAPENYFPVVPGHFATQSVAFFCFSLLHACVQMGVLNAVVFVIITSILAWHAEEMELFGQVLHTAKMGPQIGKVPILVPVGWFMVAYPSYIIVNIISEGSLLPKQGAGILRLAWMSIITAIVITCSHFLGFTRRLQKT